VNLFEAETKADEGDPPGYQVPFLRFGPSIGASALGMTIYDLAPGNSICPYHYEMPEEEWLFVITGRPTLRVPDREHELEPGDVVCFRSGPDGAHKVTNRTDEPVRVAMLGTRAEAGYSVYPDSDKVNVFPLRKIYRIETAVDYWDRES
jgi:uncharacterized cupin superfamily protein